MAKVKIELKNVQTAAFASEETTCFSASLYINDTKVGTARNQGHGGATRIEAYNKEAQELVKLAEEYCATLPSYKSDHFDLDVDLEFYIDLLVEQSQTARELKRLMKNKVVAVKDGDPKGQYYVLKSPLASAQRAQDCNPDLRILNLLPFEEALKLYSVNKYLFEV